MEFRYHRAGLEDLERLTAARLTALRTFNHLEESADLSEMVPAVEGYYRRALADGSHVAYLVLDGERVVGSGGVDFYRGIPTGPNPSGESAYLMNIYTDPACRGQGIAWKVVDLLVAEARRRGVSAIALETTDMGRPLYERYGFRQNPRRMELPASEAGLEGEREL